MRTVQICEMVVMRYLNELHCIFLVTCMIHRDPQRSTVETPKSSSIIINARYGGLHETNVKYVLRRLRVQLRNSSPHVVSVLPDAVHMRIITVFAEETN